jgi:hypothetical protein
LNKLSGFYGILSFDFSDKIATIVYLYCLAAIAVFSYGLYGLYTVSRIRIDIINYTDFVCRIMFVFFVGIQ